MTAALVATYPAQTAHLVRRIERGRGRDRVLALVELRTLPEGYVAWEVGVRALARELGADPSFVRRCLDGLVEDGLLCREGNVLSLGPGPHLAELVRQDAAPAPKASPPPTPKAHTPAPLALPVPARPPAPPIVFDAELRAILGRSDLDAQELERLEAQDALALAPLTPRRNREAPPQIPQDHARLPAPVASPPSPPPKMEASGPCLGADAGVVEPGADQDRDRARELWRKFFGTPRAQADRPWDGLRSMSGAQILTVILLLLEVRAREGYLRSLRAMSQTQAERVLGGLVAVHAWTTQELEQVAAGASLRDLLERRAEQAVLHDSPATPLYVPPPERPPLPPAERRILAARALAALTDDARLKEHP